MSQPVHREPVSFLVFSGALRTDSLNTILAALAAATIRAKGGQVDLASMADFDCPFYNQDEASKFYPCVKTAWVEFLGEQVDLHVDRVQTAGAVGR